MSDMVDKLLLAALPSLPELPETNVIGIVFGGREYEPEWTSYQDGYTEDDMKYYAVECLKKYIEESLKNGK
jgi:hypothetical protein